MKSEDLALLLASDAIAPTQPELEPLDRVRVQKAIYILQESGPDEWQGFFEYIAWDWGPFSKDLAATLDDLVRDGLLRAETVPYRYPRYTTTPAGEERVRELLDEIDHERVKYIASVRRYVTSRSFDQLLREVYDAYPEMAGKSRFRF